MCVRRARARISARRGLPRTCVFVDPLRHHPVQRTSCVRAYISLIILNSLLFSPLPTSRVSGDERFSGAIDEYQNAESVAALERQAADEIRQAKRPSPRHTREQPRHEKSKREVKVLAQAAGVSVEAVGSPRGSRNRKKVSTQVPR